MGSLMMTIAVVCALGQTEQMDTERKKEVEAWRTSFRDMVKEYHLTLADERTVPLRRIERPVFLWNQTVRHGQIGSLYIWVQKDSRPAAIGTLFTWNMGTPEWEVMHEFHSLALQPLNLNFRSRNVWSPTQPGLNWNTIDDDSQVATSRPMQLSQLRRLARRFQATTVTAENARWVLRLLPRPLYEYATGEGDTLKCGAVFAMCQGTDPELILVIEARPTENGTRWHYGCGTFTDYELHLQYRDLEVWNAPATPHGTTFSPSKPYWREFITRTAPLPTLEKQPAAK